MKLTNAEVIKDYGSPAYLYAKRNTGEVVRSNLTLGLAYNIACSGELSDYA